MLDAYIENHRKSQEIWIQAICIQLIAQEAVKATGDHVRAAARMEAVRKACEDAEGGVDVGRGAVETSIQCAQDGRGLGLVVEACTTALTMLCI